MNWNANREVVIQPNKVYVYEYCCRLVGNAARTGGTKTTKKDDIRNKVEAYLYQLHSQPVFVGSMSTFSNVFYRRIMSCPELLVKPVYFLFIVALKNFLLLKLLL